MPNCIICRTETKKAKVCHIHSHYSRGHKCKTCNKPLLNKNKTGYCNSHRDRTGKNNSFFGKKHSKETIDTSKIKLATISKNLWKDDAYRAKVIKAVSKPRRKGFKQEQSLRTKQWYKDNPEQRNIRSESMQKRWKDGNLPGHYSIRSESRLERDFVRDLRNKTGLKIVKKTIKGEKRCFFPDALDEQLRIIIEFYGDFWHANPEIYDADQIIIHNMTAQQIWDKDEKRVTNLKNMGYDVIIVWQLDYERKKEQILNYLDACLNWDFC